MMVASLLSEHRKAKAGEPIASAARMAWASLLVTSAKRWIRSRLMRPAPDSKCS